MMASRGGTTTTTKTKPKKRRGRGAGAPPSVPGAAPGAGLPPRKRPRPRRRGSKRTRAEADAEARPDADADANADADADVDVDAEDTPTLLDSGWRRVGGGDHAVAGFVSLPFDPNSAVLALEEIDEADFLRTRKGSMWRRALAVSAHDADGDGDGDAEEEEEEEGSEEGFAPKAKQKPRKKKRKKRGNPSEAEASAAPDPPARASSPDAEADDAGRADTSSPSPPAPDPPSLLAWEQLGLSRDLFPFLVQKGFLTPTPVQRRSLEACLLRGCDVVAAAETGSGKTLAFGLPLVNLLHEENVLAAAPGGGGDSASPGAGRLRALVMAPTRELALQIRRDLSELAAFASGVSVVPVIGGVSMQKQLRLLAWHPPVVVATPGRFIDICDTAGGEWLADLSALRFLVVDEADRLLEAGHFVELRTILARIRGVPGHPPVRHGRPRRRTFLASATLLRHDTSPDDGDSSGGLPVADLFDALQFENRVETVNLTPVGILPAALSEHRVECLGDEKDDLLYYLATRTRGRILCFLNSIASVRRAAAVLARLEIAAFPLHAEMKQPQRLRNLERFQALAAAVLLTTDVAARGMHVPAVDLVVHYHVPTTADLYVHRSGRTARMNAAGSAVTLVGPGEHARFRRILHALGKTEPPALPLSFEVLRLCRQRIRLAQQIAAALSEDARVQHHRSFAVRAAGAFGIDPGGVDSGGEGSDSESGDSRGRGGGGGGRAAGGGGRARRRFGRSSAARAMRALQVQLTALLREPLVERPVRGIRM